MGNFNEYEQQKTTGIYAIADYYCIYNFTFTLLFTIFLIFNLVNSVICFAKK